MESVEEIQQILAGIDLDSIGGVTENMSTEFSAALKNAVDLKMKGPTFDEFESLASFIIYVYSIKISHRINPFSVIGSG